jgi:uncharacterized membrane protein YgcG
MDLKIVLLLLFTTVLAHSEIDIGSIPNPRMTYGGWVSDSDNYLTAGEKKKIDIEIGNIERETSDEIAVVIVRTTEGDVFNTAQAIFDKWKIGKKEKNNGILLLASIDERKFRTHSGYGIESVLPDGLCRVLQDRIIVPEFRESRYGEGILNYIIKIHQILTNPQAEDIIKLRREAESKRAENSDPVFGMIFSLIGFAIMVPGFIMVFLRLKKLVAGLRRHYTSFSEVKNLELEPEGYRGMNNIIIIFLIVLGSMFYIAGIILSDVFHLCAYSGEMCRGSGRNVTSFQNTKIPKIF